jgi:hypothetical protein
METNKRYFGVTLTNNWRETNGEYYEGLSHKDVAEKLPLKSKRITNDRYREIETTGKYYRITENKFGGKSFIFEIINQ